VQPEHLVREILAVMVQHQDPLTPVVVEVALVLTVQLQHYHL
jgi:hypothetical protein